MAVLVFQFKPYLIDLIFIIEKNETSIITVMIGIGVLEVVRENFQNISLLIIPLPCNSFLELTFYITVKYKKASR